MLNTPESKSSAGHHDNKKISVSTSVPESISLDKWADSGFQWAGEVNPQGFKRLSTILTAEREQAAVQLDIDLYRRNNVLHIAFTLTGEVWLTCQRCLQPVVTDLSDDYDIALLENDSQASLLDEEQDYLMLDEVITESAPEQLLPFKKLLEDEILLKVPMAPKHDDCEMSIDQFGDIPEEEETENPFAALQSLKGKLD